MAGWSDEAPASRVAQQEAENAYQQARFVDETLARLFGGAPGLWKLDAALILRLHELAVANIEDFGGTYRTINAASAIANSRHCPPPANEVPSLVAEMCEHLNAVDASAGIFYRAAYALWRLNWIHPFEDGNGRTSRALSYLLLRIDAALPLPLGRSLPEQILNHRIKYYRCLEEADAEHRRAGGKRTVKLQQLQGFLERLLTQQLADAERERVLK